MTEADKRGVVQVAGPDVSANPATEPHMSELIAVRLSRRTVLAGGMAAVAAFLTRGISAAPGYASTRNGKSTAKAGELLGFAAIPLGFGDEVAVPAGYTARAFIPWGTPILGSFPPFRPGANTAEEQAQQIGMHHDGMHFFPLSRGPSGSTRGLLVLNHEYTDERYLHTGTATMPRSPRGRWRWSASPRTRTVSASSRSLGAATAPGRSSGRA
jgi:secreted PhoX family phosphatase